MSMKLYCYSVSDSHGNVFETIVNHDEETISTTTNLLDKNGNILDMFESKACHLEEWASENRLRYEYSELDVDIQAKKAVFSNFHTIEVDISRKEV